ncbi:MAG: glutamate-5-semialdehyde dehydrogenase, partial [Hyphomicrobium sp.]|nr:glutamate-5-semialdehyde dehydrogenase [Hyphomicrobium sp.]
MNRPERIDHPDVERLMLDLGTRARAAATELALAPTEQKNSALRAMAAALRRSEAAILKANALDVADVKAAGQASSFVDRLTLTPERIEGIAKGLEDIAALAAPVGAVIAAWERPNGLKFERVRVPIGVIGIIYESRPNVTADAGGLTLKSGNAAILRTGSDAQRSATAIHECLVAGLREAGLPEAAITLVPTTDRAAVGHMLAGLNGAIDVIVPRGGKGLVGRVQQEARVPVFAHLEGICHTFIDREADLDIAVPLVINGKLRRTGVCGATECLLVDRKVAGTHLAPLVKALLDAGCEVRGDAETQKADARVKAAQPDDYGHEFLDAIIAAKVVDGIDEAIAHIARYGSQHTDSIITTNDATAEQF